MLTKKQVENIINEQKVVFTTVSKDLQPRSIWVMPSRVESERMILSNIQMEKSLKNIRENNKCFINVFFPNLDDLQYKIEGVAEEIVNGELFEEIKSFEESENLPPELKVKSIIVIKFSSFEECNG